MYEKIRFELFVIKEVMKAVWREIRYAKYPKPLQYILPGVFPISKGRFGRGSYYTYIKDRYSC